MRTKRLFTWLRAIIVISALMAGQLQVVMAAGTGSDTSASVRGDVAGSGDSASPYLQYPGECAVGINAYLLQEGYALPVGFEPTGAAPYGAQVDSSPAQRRPGVTTTWLVVAEDKIATCAPARTQPLQNFTIKLTFTAPGGVNYGQYPVTLSKNTLSTDGELTWGTVDFQIPMDIPGTLNVATFFDGEDGGGGTVQDQDTDMVTILGPGFRIDSFIPDTGNPDHSATVGQFISFTLTVTNVRSTTITGFDIVAPTGTQGDPTAFTLLDNWCSEYPHFPTDPVTAPHFPSHWTSPSDGDPITALAPGESAFCTVENVPVPASVGSSFRIYAGVVGTTGQTDFDVTLQATSDPAVTVLTPSVSLSKRVSKIIRAGQTIYDVNNPAPNPLPSANVGDTISYEIVATNTSSVPLKNVLINDDWIGPHYVGDLAGNTSTTWMPSWLVAEGSPDPFNNIARVTGTAEGYPNPVTAQASALVDIADSALQLTLEVIDPVTLNPKPNARVGDSVQYKLTLHNSGSNTISSLQFVTLAPPLYTLGSPPAFAPSYTVEPGIDKTVYWPSGPDYFVVQESPDPLINTVRVRGQNPSGQLIYGQAQATLDVSSDNIIVAADVVDPETGTVLRGSNAVYHIRVWSDNAISLPICDIRVDQYLYNTNTGVEQLLIPNIPLNYGWSGAVPGRLDDVSNVADAATTYLVTGQDSDPLTMIFRVSGTPNCTPGNTLTDSTTRALDISDAQINAELVADVGPDGIAKTGETVDFNFFATNVGIVTLSGITAKWCITHLDDGAGGGPYCGQGLTNLGTEVGALDTISDTFNYTIQAGDENANPFLIEVTMLGYDNKDHQISVKAATTIDVATDSFVLDVGSDVSPAVVGDTIPFTVTFTNDGTTDFDAVRLYQPVSGGGFQEITLAPPITSLPGNGGSETRSFDYTIAPGGLGVTEKALTVQFRAEGDVSGEDTVVVTNGTAATPLVPMLTVTKTGDAVGIINGSVNYTVDIANNSYNQQVTDLSFEDTVLDDYGVTNYSAGDAGWSWPGDAGTLNPRNLNDDTYHVTQSFTINDLQPEPNPLVNTFTATGNREYDGGEVTGFGQHKVEIGCPLAITFQVVDIDNEPDLILGEWLNWDITLQNLTTGSVNVTSLTEDLYHDGTTDVLNEFSWPTGTVGELGSGQVASLSFQKQITNKYYGATLGDDDFMPDSVTANFTGVADASSCTASTQFTVYSPILVTKIPDRDVAFTGETVNYTITVENLSEDDDAPYDTFTGVTVVDDLLGPVTLDYSSGTGTVGTLGPGEVATSVPDSLSHEVQASDPEELVNTARADFPDPADSGFSFYTIGTATVFTGNPLELTKTPSTSLAAPGSTITYDYTITNVSPREITDISLTDDVVGAILPRAQDAPPLVDNPNDDCDLSTGGTIDLLPGQTCLILGVEYTIQFDDPDPLTNIAEAHGYFMIADSTHEVFSTATAVVDLEDANLDMTFKAYQVAYDPISGDPIPGDPLPDDFPTTGPDGIPEVTTGESVFFCFTVDNTNSDTTWVEDIALDSTSDLLRGRLDLPFQTAVIDAYGVDPTEANKLLGGQGVEFCLDPTQLDNSMGDVLELPVTLDGQSSSFYPVHVEASLSIDVMGRDILITKLPSAPLAFVGEDITYLITIENLNASTDILVDSVTDSIFGDLELDRFDWTQSGVAGSPVGWLGPKGTNPHGGQATLIYTYTVQSFDPDPLRNKVTVLGNLDDGVAGEQTPVGDSALATVAVTDSQLVVRKSVTPTIVRPSSENCELKDGVGDDPLKPACVSVSYTISITNVGTEPVQGIEAWDTHFDVAQNQMVEENLTLTRTELAPFQTAYSYYTLAIPMRSQLTAMPDLDPFMNQVKVYGVVLDANGDPIPISQDDPEDPHDDGKSLRTEASASVDILQSDLRIQKVPQVQASAPGGTVTYDITILNLGEAGADVNQLVFTDLMDPSNPKNLDQDCAGGDLVECGFAYGDQPDHPYDPVHKLQSGETLVGTVTVSVPTDWSEAEFTNVVEITGMAGTEPLQDRGSATIVIRDEGINVTKHGSATSAPIGASVEYTVTVTNIGTSPIDRLTIYDKGMDPATVYVDGAVFPDSPEDGDQVDNSSTLDPGETYTMMYSHVISLLDDDPYVNRVTVTGRLVSGGSSVVNVAQATVDVLQAAIEVEKFACVGDSLPDTPPADCSTVVNLADAEPDVITYYLHFTNPSYVAVTDLIATDTRSDLSGIVWPVDPQTMDPGQDFWWKYTYTVQPGDPDSLENLVTVSGQAGAIAVQDSASASVSLVNGDLQVVKTGPSQAQIGQTVKYIIEVTNLGTDSIVNVKTTDPMNGAVPIGDCSPPVLGAGATVVCDYLHVISLADGSPVVNTVTSEGTLQSSGLPVSDSSTHTLDVVSGSLLVSKTADKAVVDLSNDPTVTYTYVIKNTGTGEITELVVDDSDPSIVFTDAQGNPKDWDSVLIPGGQQVRYATRTLTAQDPDPYTNTITVEGHVTGHTLTAYATATVLIANDLAGGALVVSNHANKAFAKVGDPVTFTYTVTNVGTPTLDTLYLDDNICGPAVLNTQLETTVLASGESATVYCSTTAALPGPVSSTVYAKANNGGVDVFDTATAEVAVYEGGLVVTKQADRPVVVAEAGQNVINYTLTVTNVGTELITITGVDDPLVGDFPPSLVGVQLAPNGSVTRSAPYTVDLVSPPSVVNNTVTVTATGNTSGDTYQDSDTAAVAVLENADATLLLTTEVSPLMARPGQSLTMRYTVRNISSVNQTGITLQDPFLGYPPQLYDPPEVGLPDLGPGNVAIKTFTVQVPIDYTSTVLSSTAGVYTAADGLQDEADTSVAIELLALEKDATSPALLGGQIDYTFTIHNYSTSALTNVTIDDPVIDDPLNLGVWDDPVPASLPGGITVALAHIIVPETHEETTFDNTADLLYNGVIQDTASASSEVIQAGLAVEDVTVSQEISDNPTTVITDNFLTGLPIDVSFDLRNTGTEAITDLTYTVDTGLTGMPCTLGTGVTVPDTLNPAGTEGDTTTIECVFTPMIGDADYVTNGLARTLEITGDGTSLEAPLQGTAEVEYTLVDLQLIVTLTPDPDGGLPGDTVTFTVGVENAGASPLGCDATVAADEPCHILISTASTDTEFADLIDAIADHWANIVLAPGASDEVDAGNYVIPENPTPNAEGKLTFTIVGDGGYYDADLGDLLSFYTAHDDFTAEFQLETAEITVNVTVTPNPPVLNQPVTFTIQVQNTGSITVNNLTGTYQISPYAAFEPGLDGIMLVSGQQRPGRQASSGSLVLNPTSLAPGASAYAYLSTVETHTGPYAFIATVIGDGLSVQDATAIGEVDVSPLTTGTGTGTPTLDPNATEPIVVKTPSVTDAQVGDAVTWTITVRNGGTGIQSNVTLQDTLPDTLSMVSTTSTSGAAVVAGQTVTVTIGTLNPGDTATVTMATSISSTATSPSIITNTACATREGGVAQCVSASVNIGPGVTSLPSTGVAAPRGHSGGLPGMLGIALVGVLLVLMGAQISRRRMWMAVAFVVIAVAIIAGALVLLLSGGDETKNTSQEAAQVATATPVPPETLDATPIPGSEAIAPIPPASTPYIVPTPAGVRYLVIPKLSNQFDVPIPIVDLPIVNRQWDVSGLGYYVGWLEGTTWMDPDWGNTVLAAHVQLGFNNPGPFWGLASLNPGDEIDVIEGQVKRRFVVSSVQKVDPSDWSVTSPTRGPTLTLITCTDWSNSYGVFAQRLVVRAVPVA